MQLGMIGLGRMGGNIVRRLMNNGHHAVVYDRDPKAVDALIGQGATGAGGLAEFVGKLQTPRAVWVMLPAGPMDARRYARLASLRNGQKLQVGPEGFQPSSPQTPAADSEASEAPDATIESTINHPKET